VTPVRTCVGCGARAPQPTLHRFVAERDGGLRADSARRAPGRGAYLHLRAECLRRFARATGAVRSLRRTPTPAARARLAAQLDERIAEAK
jgi:predicted RNA-binding protein YlxR (DUF448 family)